MDILRILSIVSILFLIMGLAMIGFTVADKKNFSTGEDDFDIPTELNEEQRKEYIKRVKENRVQGRGTLASFGISAVVTVIGVVMARMCVNDTQLEVLFGYLLVPVLGFMVDIGFGTDEGYGLFKSGQLHKWMSLVFSSLWDYSFVRFVVSFLLDLFISKPLAGIIRGNILKKIVDIVPRNGLERWLAENLTSFIQTVVAVITFQAYTNQTRFLWAYPDKGLPKESRLSSFGIMIATSISAVFYMYVYRKDTANFKTHIALVFAALLILTFLSKMNQMDAPMVDVESEEEVEEKKFGTYSTYVGVLICIFFTLIGLVWPLYKASCANKGNTDDYDVLIREMMSS